MVISREKHIAWCKERALQTLETSGPEEAYTSMLSDMGKHEETKDHLALNIGYFKLIAGQLSDPEKMKEFILGFN